MIGFLLRKTLYDLWDNMFKILFVNVGFAALAAIPVFLPRLAAKLIDSQALEIALSVFGILICSIYLAAAAYTIKSISDYGSFSFRDLLKNVKTAWPAGLVMGFLVCVLFLVVTIIIPFYMSVESPVGLVLAAIIFWTTIFGVLSFQFFFTVCVRLCTPAENEAPDARSSSGKNLIKAFKKCMLITLDNSGFVFFSLLYNIAALILSVILAFMLPGPAGILLYLDEALRLRLLKYDWLEANLDANRRKIPWDALLIDEREKTGTRNLKNFIFPWKD